MTFLSPWIFAGALLLAGVPIVLLHMLKLRRQRREVPTTMLWRRSVEDLVANVPFQRLRWSLLLLLQLAAATALAAALGRPATEGAATLGGRVIVLLDRSASMNALLHDPGASTPASEAEAVRSTRLDHAKSLLGEVIARRGRTQETLLIAFAQRPQALGGFESSPQRLLEALREVQSTDEEADLDAALELASAFARSASLGAEQGGDDAMPSILLVTDGNVRPPAAGIFEVAASSVQVLPIGRPADGPGAQASAPRRRGPGVDNIGVVDLAVERPYDDPASARLFARLTNAADEARESVVTIRTEGRTLLRRTVLIPPAGDDGPGEIGLDERLDVPNRALVLLEQGRADLLASDDVAAALLPAPRTPSVILVVPADGPDPFLRTVLEAILDLAQAPSETARQPLSIIDVEAWASRHGGDDAATTPPDLVIFDRVAPPQRPGVPSFSIGVVPSWLEAGDPLQPGRARRILSWDRRHPVLRHVDLDDMVYTAFGGYAPGSPDTRVAVEPLALGAEGPVLVAATDRGVRHLSLGPDLRRSNLPALPSFPILLRNAVDWLGAFGAADAGRVLRAGEAAVVRARPGVERLGLREPEGTVRSIPVSDPSGVVVLPPLSRRGVWTVDGAVPEDEIIPVSQLSALESDLAFGPEPAIAIVAPRQRRVPSEAVSDLWPWMLLAALGLCVLEWAAWLFKAGRA